MPKLLKIAKIVWYDAHHYESGNWVSREDAQADHAVGIRVTTVGILLRKSKKYYTVCSTETDVGQVTGVFNVPKACVHSVTYL